MRGRRLAWEIALEKVFKETELLIHDMRKFFFTMPKTKENAVIYTLTRTPWVFLFAVCLYVMPAWSLVSIAVIYFLTSYVLRD